MKKSKTILMFILPLLLVGCDWQLNLGSSNLSSSPIQDSSSSSSQFIDSSSSSSSKNESSSSSSIDIDNLNVLKLNSSLGFDIGTYSTGNYSNQFNGDDINNVNGYTFEHYRATSLSGGFMNLLPYYDSTEDGTLPGSFYNVDCISGIVKIGIEYANLQVEGNGLKLSYGENVDLVNSTIMEAVSSYQYIEINLGYANFFKIETTGLTLKLKEIKIFYIGEGNTTAKYMGSGTNEYRLNPTKYTGELVDGESKLSVPAKIEVNEDGTYVVTEHKVYTYYSYSYVSKYPQYADEAAMTDPVDVAAYYIAFHQYPANYYSSNNQISSYFSIFGKNTRRVSKIYSRTDGYVNAVPDDESDIQYVEFDIAIGDTYISDSGSVTRGVGRVVMFFSGFDAEGYDNSPVAVYTDDHYATFQEYLNTGSYGKRFNAQSHNTAYNWGNYITLN